MSRELTGNHRGVLEDFGHLRSEHDGLLLVVSLPRCVSGGDGVVNQLPHVLRVERV